MNARMHWSLLAAVIFMTAPLAKAQSQSQGAQASVSEVTPVGSDLSTDIPMGHSADASQLSVSQSIDKAFLDLSQAFADRDSSALRRAWPSIPAATYNAVAKSFGYFKNTSRKFSPEQIQVKGDTATVSGTYSGSFIKGSTVLPSNGTFHATAVRIENGWVLSSLVCN